MWGNKLCAYGGGGSDADEWHVSVWSGIELRDLLNLICVNGVSEGVSFKWGKEVELQGVSMDLDRIYIKYDVLVVGF